MIMEDNSLFIFMKVCEDFVKSSLELRNAATLCDEDPIKQEMIAFVTPEFNKMWAKSEGIKVLLEKDHFADNREFILSEMRDVTLKNRRITAQIQEKLGTL
tara:strand:- start:120 stop:422 length:303 start_codon:yes stop_codon:yes gene_type:complete